MADEARDSPRRSSWSTIFVDDSTQVGLDKDGRPGWSTRRGIVLVAPLGRQSLSMTALRSGSTRMADQDCRRGEDSPRRSSWSTIFVDDSTQVGLDKDGRLGWPTRRGIVLVAPLGRQSLSMTALRSGSTRMADQDGRRGEG